MNPKDVVAVFAILNLPLVTRESLEKALKKQSLTSVQASSAIQIAINEGLMYEDMRGFLHRASLLRRLWSRRPWRKKAASAQEILSQMKPIGVLPEIGRFVRGHPMSEPCELAQLRDDNSLLVHNVLAMYSFDEGRWVEFPEINRSVAFEATHYRTAVRPANRNSTGTNHPLPFSNNR